MPSIIKYHYQNDELLSTGNRYDRDSLSDYVTYVNRSNNDIEVDSSQTMTVGIFYFITDFHRLHISIHLKFDY